MQSIAKRGIVRREVQPYGLKDQKSNVVAIITTDYISLKYIILRRSCRAEVEAGMSYLRAPTKTNHSRQLQISSRAQQKQIVARLQITKKRLLNLK